MIITGPDSCDKPNGSWKQHGQHYYWVTGSKLNYNDAKAECEKVPGGQLAEILDKATLLFFHNELDAIGGGMKHTEIEIMMLNLLVIINNFAVSNYFIDLLKGDKTPWDDWYRSSRSWTWQTSGNPFPADDADQNWNDAQWDRFVLYVKVSLNFNSFVEEIS